MSIHRNQNLTALWSPSASIREVEVLSIMDNPALSGGVIEAFVQDLRDPLESVHIRVPPGLECEAP